MFYYRYMEIYSNRNNAPTLPSNYHSYAYLFFSISLNFTFFFSHKSHVDKYNFLFVSNIDYNPNGEDVQLIGRRSTLNKNKQMMCFFFNSRSFSHKDKIIRLRIYTLMINVSGVKQIVKIPAGLYCSSQSRFNPLT